MLQYPDIVQYVTLKDIKDSFDLNVFISVAGEAGDAGKKVLTAHPKIICGESALKSSKRSLSAASVV